MALLTNIVLTAASRLVLLFAWLLTDAVQVAFSSFIPPLLGFIFLPFATLMYVIAFDPVEGMTTGGWIAVALVVPVDLLVLAATTANLRHRSGVGELA